MIYVIISPVADSTITARLRDENGIYMYATFVKGTIYEVTEDALTDLKKYKSAYPKQSLQSNLGLELNLKYTVKEVGCSSCARKRGYKPEDLARYQFDDFIQADEQGNILDIEKNG